MEAAKRWGRDGVDGYVAPKRRARVYGVEAVPSLTYLAIDATKG